MSDSRQQSEAHSQPHLALGTTLAILLLVALLLAWYSHTRQQDFRQNQIQVMQATVDATAADLSLYIRDLRRHVALFAQDRQPLFQQLAEPTSADKARASSDKAGQQLNDKSPYNSLQQAIKTHFPHYFAFTIADTDGTPLLQDLDGLVGRGCRRDIRRYADHPESHQVYIHSSPGQHRYHFDIMVPWQVSGQATSSPERPGKGNDFGVFFVSFFVDDVAHILKNAQHLGDQLVLVRQDQPDTIEITAAGARDEIAREQQLTAAEMASVSATARVPNTRWLLYDLPAPDWLDAYRNRVRNEALFVFALFAVVALILLLFINRSERALRDSNRDLSRSLERLRETREHLVQSEKMAALGGLVAGVAHEINTPVGTAITASSHLVEEQQRTRRALEQGALKKSQLQSFIATNEEGSNIILTNLQRAAELIKSFKLVASDQASQERRQFELCAYLNEVLMSLRPKVKHSPHQLTLDCPGEIPMEGYPGALAQIVTNLLDNALLHAFTPKQPGHFAIRVRRQQEQVRLQFSDDGCGMDQDTVTRVFEPFFTRNREHGGTGLGLHIVYNLVSGKLQGRIACDSRPGEGSRFTLTLPLILDADGDHQGSNKNNTDNE